LLSNFCKVSKEYKRGIFIPQGNLYCLNVIREFLINIASAKDEKII